MNSSPSSYRIVSPLALCLAMMLFAGSTVWGQTASATWALTSSPGSPAESGNIAATNITKGSSIGTLSFNSNGVYATSWEQTSLDLNKYYQYTISPDAGYYLTITSITLPYRIGDRSIADQRMTAAVYYSLNNDFSNAVQIGSNFSVSKTFTNFSATPSISVDADQTIYLRVYGWGAQYNFFGWTPDASAVFRNRNVVISGTTTACPAITATVNNQTNVSCYAGTNGSFTITASGGTAPYTFSLNNGGTYVNGDTGTQKTFSGLTAGNYYPRVKDANGCESPNCP